MSRVPRTTRWHDASQHLLILRGMLSTKRPTWWVATTVTAPPRIRKPGRMQVVVGSRQQAQRYLCANLSTWCLTPLCRQDFDTPLTYGKSTGRSTCGRLTSVGVGVEGDGGGLVAAAC